MWVKKTKLSKMFDISLNTISKYIKNGTFLDGTHYKDFPFGLRFNPDKIERLSENSTPKLDKMIDKMLLL